MVRPLKLTWKVQLDDRRVVKVIEYRDMDDFNIDFIVEGLDFGDMDLVDKIQYLVDTAHCGWYC